MSTVFVIADTHEPHAHPDYLDFCVQQAKHYGATEFVHIGDEVDHHYLSYHEKIIEQGGPGDEFEAMRESLKPWMKAFPKLRICIGNHTNLPFRKARTHQIPGVYLRRFSELWNSPKGWEWDWEFEIDDVLYTHKPSHGVKMALNNNIDGRMRSSVFGHTHIRPGVVYAKKKGMKQLFSLNVGWGGDQDAYAFEYAKEFAEEGVVGAGLVIDGKEAHFLPMI
jgi:predicted phosphodiesterase